MLSLDLGFNGDPRVCFPGLLKYRSPLGLANGFKFSSPAGVSYKKS